MTEKLLKSWTPNTTYEFDLRIADKDYSNDLISVNIKSAVSTPYQNISLDLYLDSTDIITDKIYGQTPIKLSIKLKAQQNWPQEEVDFDLLFLNIDTDFAMQRGNQLADQAERTAVRFNTILRPSYETMTTIVNGLYFGQKPESIVRNVLSNTTADIDYDTNGKSSLPIDQFLIPPSTVYQSIKYLDRVYGIFNGTLGFHCTFDNKVKVQNLSKNTTASQALSIYQLATNIDQEKILSENDPDKFYTKTPIKVFNRGNSIFLVQAPTNRYIVKPRDQLSKVFDINTENLTKTFGIVPPNTSNFQTVYYDKEAIKTNKRIMYHINQTGYDSDNTFINSNLSKSIQDISQIAIELQHNLPILNLMAVGEGVNFIPQIADYKPLGGMYVLKASELGWIRSKVWESWARVHLMRSIITTQ